MKELYDSHMFDFMWESVIPRDDMIVGTYYIEDTLEDQDFIDHLGQVERLAAEGSTSSWMDVKELTPEVRERLMSKVLGYYEVPAPKGTKKAIIQLGFPTAAWDVNVNVPMLLLSIAGNCFAFPTKMRMLDMYIPEKLAKKFKGPKFGIPGVREILGVYDRPLTLQIIKPKMGMTPEETANQVYQSALGGADLCKDDEMCTELANCSFEARLEAVLKALKKAEDQTGHKTLYMVSITDEVDRVQEKARKACEMGATGLLLAYSAGPSVLRVLAEDPEDHRADPAARLAPAGAATDDEFPDPGEDLPVVRRGYDAHTEHLVEHPGGVHRRVPARLADAARALLPHQADLPDAGRGHLPRRGAADAGRERPGHDLHGGRRHVGASDGLHCGRGRVPPGDRRGHGRHPAGRRRKGQARADGRAEDLGPAQTPGHTLGLLRRAVSSEVRGEGCLGTRNEGLGTRNQEPVLTRPSP